MMLVSGSDGLTVARVPPERWQRLEDWDAVLAGSARPTVFLTRDWVTSWWAVYGYGAEPWLLRVAGPTGEPLGLAPLYLGRGPGTLACRSGDSGSWAITAWGRSTSA